MTTFARLLLVLSFAGALASPALPSTPPLAQDASAAAPQDQAAEGQEPRAQEPAEPAPADTPPDVAEALAEAERELAALEQRRDEHVAALAALEAAGKDASADIKSAVDRSYEALDEQARLLRAAADRLAAAGGDGSPYRARAAVVTRRLDDARDLNPSVLLALGRGWFDQAYAYVRTDGPKILFQLVFAVALWIVFSLVANLIARVVRRALASPRVRATGLLKDFLVGFVKKIVIAVGLLVILNQLGVQVAPLLAGLGIAGFIAGFALQDTLSNFAAGVMILFYRPFDIGHVVRAGGENGTVREVSLVSTTLDTPDNQRLIVPNKKIWGDTILNVTANPTRRIDLVISISYEDDVARAQAILERLLEEEERVLELPAPTVRLDKLAESSLDFVVWPWVKAIDYGEVRWALLRRIKAAFDEAGISIPYPQRELHVRGLEQLAVGARRGEDSRS